ncbi:MAG TPA: sigma-70 family RNA polymerase sigma factor [bacterium]|nr:sigma-70 family RNA polymerase sigma factor [bacterium]
MDWKILYSHRTDEALMARVQKGDARAMTVLYERYNRRLLVFFRRMLGGKQVAEDMLQETFLHLIDRAGLYDSAKKFSTWLFCIAYNLCKNEYRRRQRRKSSATIEDLLHSDYPLADNLTVDLHEEITSRFFLEAVFRELEKLGPERKSLFLLRCQQELSVHEIAEITGLAEGTVKSRLFYINKILADRLESFHPSPHKA